MPTTRNCLVPSVLVTSRNVLPAGVTRAAAKGNDIDIDLDKFKKIQPAPHHKMPPPQSILVRFPHLKRQNPSPRLDESDRRQRFERRWAGFPLRRGFASSVAIKKKKKYSGHHITKSPPLSQLLSDFLISSAKIHLQDSTRAISDSGLNVVGRFFHKGGDLHPACTIEKNTAGATSQKAPPQSILVRFPHLKRQNPSPRIDESDKRQQFERRRAVFHKGGDLHPARAIEKKKKKNIAGATLQKAPPQSILVRFPHLKRQKFISKTRREQSAIAV
jgi:hypothetical protein